MQLPNWFTELPPEEQKTERTKLLLRMAALYGTREGTIQALSRALGYHENSLGTLSHAGRTIAPALAVKIEQLCGREHITREMLNPMIFAPVTE